MKIILMQEGFLTLCVFSHKNYTLPIYYCYLFKPTACFLVPTLT